MSQQQPDNQPGYYYVSVVKDGGDWRPLRGPFINDHAAALAAVDAAKERAIAFDPKAHWYAYGTVRAERDLGAGIFDRMDGQHTYGDCRNPNPAPARSYNPRRRRVA